MTESITPFDVVEKLQRLKQDVSHEPWIEELLWFLQAVSTNNRQGLYGIAVELKEAFPDNLGPESFAAAAKQRRLSRSHATEFWKSVPIAHQEQFKGVVPDAWTREWHSIFDGDGVIPAGEAERKRGLPELETEAVRRVIERIAVAEIERCLKGLFKSDSSVNLECWSFRQLADALRRLMQGRVLQAQMRIAQTSVVTAVFDALDFAWSEGVMVQIEGDPRFGKTEAIRAYCEMYPGRVRLVTVPSETTDKDFFIAVAEALQIEIGGPACDIGDLRRRIDYILKHCQLMLIVDEAHFLIPQRYGESTPPIRMNWVRTRVADRGLPAALLVTPQSFDDAFKKFVKKTRYRFDQFLGRMASFKLPADLALSDVIAVAQIHFPDIKLPYLKLIAGKAMQSAGYLQAVEFTAKRARFLASRPGRDGMVTEQDVRRAIEEMMPGKSDATRQKQPCKPSATPRMSSSGQRGPEVISEQSTNDNAPSRMEAALLVA